jgi:transposase
MEIGILHRQGKSLRQIAREMGISINTVRKYLSKPTPPVYGPRPRRAHKLDAYEGFLRSRVTSALPDKIPATVLLREIQEQGYPGGISQLKAFLRTVRPKPKPEPLVRFSTLPGVQMQADWVEFKRDGLYAFVATLGYSRASFVTYAENMKLPSLLACHKDAFDFFGGVPQEVLYDNVKTVVLLRDALGAGLHRFHPTYWDFAKHYGFVPRLCRPYRAKTKGKVERFNRYLRYSFHVPTLSRLKMEGKTLDTSLATVLVKKWLREVANARVHKDTRRVPLEVLSEERLTLRPLPPPYGSGVVPMPSHAYPVVPPQHGLSTYNALLEVA